MVKRLTNSLSHGIANILEEDEPAAPIFRADEWGEGGQGKS
jgi:hypothetical protein